MTPRLCMINVMADIIGMDDTYTGDRLNEAQTWDRFMAAVFRRMDEITDPTIRDILDGIDTEEFQAWIDDPGFWSSIETEISRRINIVKTLLPSPHQGHC